jgi:RHS repeat-associated protein
MQQPCSTYQVSFSSVFDYTTFGSVMPERVWTDEDRGYRYGFNGKETDSETGLQDYGFRIYNSSLGRFLSVDPLSPQYPWYTPYQFAGNKVIIAIDVDGLEEFVVIVTLSNDGKTTQKRIDYINTDVNKNLTATRNQDGTIVYQPTSPSGIKERSTDPNNPGLGTGGVQYITKDADGNIINSERQPDFIAGSSEEYIMNLPVESYSENADMSESKPGTRRDAMGNYISKNRPYRAVQFQEVEVAKYDNASNKMQIQTEELNKVVKKIDEDNIGNREVVLIGHTDKDPMKPYITPSDPDGNKRLSEERAKNVKKELENAGVSSEKIKTHGAGSTQADQKYNPLSN